MVEYVEKVKFLGVTFDSKLSFKEHILDLVKRAHKRINLLKALKGKCWGASSEVILYTYGSYIALDLCWNIPVFYFLLRKIKAVETTAIKLAFDLAPWTTNYWTYSMVEFTPILERLKQMGTRFIDKNRNEILIKPLIDNASPGAMGLHSPLYKLLNW